MSFSVCLDALPGSQNVKLLTSKLLSTPGKVWLDSLHQQTCKFISLSSTGLPANMFPLACVSVSQSHIHTITPLLYFYYIYWYVSMCGVDLSMCELSFCGCGNKIKQNPLTVLLLIKKYHIH